MAKKKKEKKSKQNYAEVGPSQSANAYNGPIVPRPMKRQIDTEMRLFGDASTITASAGGVDVTVYGSDPTSSTQWSASSSNWDEYRTLAVKIQFVPANKRNQTVSVAYAGSVGVLWTVFDLNNITALASVQAAAEYASAEFGSASDGHTRELRAEGKELMSWNPTTGGPTYNMYIKTRFENCNASTVIGYMWTRRLVQFRGTS